MSTTTEARDAYLAVEVPLPNGTIARGKPIPFDRAAAMIVLSDEFAAGGKPSDTLIPLLAQFEEVTGITKSYLLGLCPDLTMGELVDLVNRFFYSRRPAPTSAPSKPAGPVGAGAGA